MMYNLDPGYQSKDNLPDILMSPDLQLLWKFIVLMPKRGLECKIYFSGMPEKALNSFIFILNLKYKPGTISQFHISLWSFV